MYSGVSVIICCYNSSSRIETTLDHLLNQKNSTNIDWEIVVVNNNSNDFTTEVVNKWMEENKQGNLKIKLVNESIPGLSYAREKGVSESSYDIILFCDDDNHLCDTYIEKGFNILNKNEEIGVLGGLGTPLFESEKPFWFDNYMVNYATGIPHNPLRKNHYKNNPNWAYGAAVFIKKELLLKAKNIGLSSILSDRKGNSLVSGGDYELFIWIYILGYEVTYDETLSFKHFIPSSRATLEYLYRLSFGLGQSSALIEIYQYLLESSYDIVKPKRNIGLRIARYYIFKLLKIKIKILMSSNKDTLDFIHFNFEYFYLKGRISTYIATNNKFLDHIKAKEDSLKIYLNKL